LRGYHLRAASEEDLPVLPAILDGAGEWLRSRGTDQWAASRWRAEELRPDLATGALRVAEKLIGSPSARDSEGGSPSAQGLAGAEPIGSPSARDLAGAESGPAEAGRGGTARLPVATMTLGEAASARWVPADDPASALYLGHFAVDRRCAGLGVGAWLIREAAEEAARLGKRSLRLDAWTTNARLHDYYRRQGFRLVRIADGPSGALFERAVSPR
jgi:ribosomal protein S18 acetylase RimI-like enzyme